MTTARVLLSYGLLNLVGLLRGGEWMARRQPLVHRRNARRVMARILEVQGLFIKVGQLVSVLSNFLPSDFRSELEELQDRIPPRPWPEIRAQLELELGAPAEDLFAGIDAEALASASLAQVHAARLGDGRRVAVKVQHLDIERLASLDLRTIRRILGLVSFFTGARGLQDVFDEVSAMIEQELDFTREADHIEEIGRHFAEADGYRDLDVAAPEVIRELSTSKVLVTGYVEGVKVTEAFEAPGIDRAALADRILRAYCQMIFITGIYHADPHPGNLMVTADGRLFFIDFGAVGRLSPAMKTGLPQLLEAVLRRDREQILQALRRLGFVERRGDEERVAERAIEYFYSRFLEDLEFETFDLKEIQFDPRMKLEMMADFRRLDLVIRDLTSTFKVPRDWILLVRTLFLLLGVCHQLHPEMRPMSTVRPFLEKFVLGEDRDWVGLVRRVVQDLAMTALTLPGDMKRLIGKAERGAASLEIGGVREGFSLLYALGHQVLFAALSLGCGVLGWLAHGRGETIAVDWLAGASGVFLLGLGVSFWRARRWQRRLRRSPRLPR